MGRGGRLDAHERRFYLIFRLACEVAIFTPPKLFSVGTPTCRDFQARAQDTRGESLALRRVVPSPKEGRRARGRSCCKSAERRHLDAERESTPAIGIPTKRRNRRARFVGKRSNRAQAKGKPLFRVAFLQFSADCDVGAYLVVRNEPKKGC